MDIFLEYPHFSKISTFCKISRFRFPYFFYNNHILGTHCEIADNACVQPNVCQNGGSCRPDGELGFECICPDGFYGPRCENEIDECIEQPCSNGAECINKINDFECICPPGWMGKTCQIGKFKVKGHLIGSIRSEKVK